MKDEDKKKKKISAGDIEVPKIVSASEIERMGAISTLPNVNPLSVGIQPDGLVVKASALKNYDLSLGVYGAEYLTHPANVITTKPFEDRFAFNGMATMDLPTVFPSYSATGLREPTREEIEELKKEISSLQKNSITPEQQLENIMGLLEKRDKDRQKEQEKTISMVEKQSFEIMKKMFLEGKTFAWHCKCGEILDEFKTEEDIKRIKLYLEDFRKGKLKICQKKGYRNWFELRGGEIVCSESALLDKEFRKPKETGQKLDNQQ